MAGKVSRTTAAAIANPATTTGTVGALVVLIGSQLGWDAQTIATVSSIALVAVPLVRAAAYWWETHRPSTGV